MEGAEELQRRAVIEYVVSIREPHTHLIDVEVRVPSTADTLDLVMPSWTPGSYLLREFARNVQDVAAKDSTGARLPIRKLDKGTWRVDTSSCVGPVKVAYRVHANELTVRTSHVDASHAYLNGASVFMYVLGAEHEPARVRIECPEGWRVATSLRVEDEQSFVAADYDDLVDSPFEVGSHLTLAWEQHGAPHRYAVWGVDRIDEARLIQDTRQIIDYCRSLFDGLPYDQYLFILHVVPGGRGGLEHRSSTSLQVPPSWLKGSDYESLLALVAHEFFHVWLGKRIRPEPLGPFDYTAENYTRNLWVVEGFTTYYTDLILRRAGLMTRARYLERLGDSIAKLQSLPGRLHQTLEESSFDAWIKFYRPDAHTPNAQVSYYHKGSLVALALDLEIRRATGGERSLDDVMRLLWERFGAKDIGFPEDRGEGIRAVVVEVGGEDVGELLDRYVETVEEIEFDRHLGAVGLELASVPSPASPKREGGGDGTASAAKPPASISAPPVHETALGIRISEGAGHPKVTHVLEGSPAWHAGVNAGDELVSIDDRKAGAGAIAGVLSDRGAGASVSMTFLRRETVVTLTLTLREPEVRDRHVIVNAGGGQIAISLLDDWLGG